MGDATCQGVQVEGEGRVYSGESVWVTNKDVTGWRAVNHKPSRVDLLYLAPKVRVPHDKKKMFCLRSI